MKSWMRALKEKSLLNIIRVGKWEGNDFKMYAEWILCSLDYVVEISVMELSRKCKVECDNSIKLLFSLVRILVRDGKWARIWNLTDSNLIFCNIKLLPKSISILPIDLIHPNHPPAKITKYYYYYYYHFCRLDILNKKQFLFYNVAKKIPFHLKRTHDP